MNKLDVMEDRQFVFGTILVLGNKLDTLLEREMSAFGMTSKQWFLLMVISSLFEGPPTIKEVAGVMGTSHQNVKQVALKLEQKGFLMLLKDPRDARVTRLKTTEYSLTFWEKTQQRGEEFMKAVFDNLAEEELKAVRTGLQKIWINLIKLEEEKNYPEV